VWRAALVAASVVAVLSTPAKASAHPLGNFTVNRYAGIVLSPGEIRIEYVLDLAEIPTIQALPGMDTDRDGTASSMERSAWARRTALRLLSNLTVEIAGEPVALETVSASMWLLPGQGGLDVLRFEATFAGPASTEGELAFADANFQDRVGWREITAVGAAGVILSGSTVPEASLTDALRTYPSDLLSSPLDVQGARVSFEPGADIPAPAAGGVVGASAERPGVAGGAFADLVGRSGPFMLIALLLALGFGALHALGPGHGKTLMAAYLVGAGGRARQAIAVGGSVALMHTASVLALGLVVLSATERFPPERVYPWLGLVAGLIALGLGAGLLLVRLGAWRNRTHDHDHHTHHHHEPSRQAPVLSRRGLAALAVAGGLLPSPTALVVLLASLALDRLAYGLALIGAFSLGLAAALVAVGLLALRARNVVSRRMSARVARAVPVISACAIVVVGLVLTLRASTQL
jgi:ABC-type nickel/cobalt efflux system permease component RcnA